MVADRTPNGEGTAGGAPGLAPIGTDECLLETALEAAGGRGRDGAALTSSADRALVAEKLGRAGLADFGSGGGAPEGIAGIEFRRSSFGAATRAEATEAGICVPARCLRGTCDCSGSDGGKVLGGGGAYARAGTEFLLEA